MGAGECMEFAWHWTTEDMRLLQSEYMCLRRLNQILILFIFIFDLGVRMMQTTEIDWRVLALNLLCVFHYTIHTEENNEEIFCHCPSRHLFDKRTKMGADVTDKIYISENKTNERKYNTKATPHIIIHLSKIKNSNEINFRSPTDNQKTF